MQVVRTETILQVSHRNVDTVTLRLKSKETLKENVLKIVNEMKSSGLFSAEGLEKIEQFLRQFAQLDPDHETNRERVSLLLCFLLCDVINEALLDEQSQEEERKLQDFEASFLELLNATVPPGETVAEFVKSFIELSLEEEKVSDEEQCLREEIKRIDECFKEKMKELYQSANQEQREIKKLFDELKQRIQAINTSRQSMTEELIRKFDPLTLKIEKISTILEDFCLAQDSLGQKMKEDQHAFDKITTDFENLLKKM